MVVFVKCEFYICILVIKYFSTQSLFFATLSLASLADVLLAHHTTLGRKDCVISQKSVYEGDYFKLGPHQ